MAYRDEIDKQTFFEEIKEDINEYAHLQVKLAKLSVFEKVSMLMGFMITGIALLVIFLLSLIFLSLVSGLYLSSIMNSYFQGFGIVSLFYFLLFIFIFAFRKAIIEKVVVNNILRILMENESKEEEDEL